MEQPKEDRASMVQLRQFAAMLDRLPCWDDGVHAKSRGGLLLAESGTKDRVGVAELAQSGNVLIDKCIATFSTLAVEVQVLVDEARNTHYHSLLAYGEDVDGSLLSEGGAVKMTARFLPFLQQLSVFVNRCCEVVRNIILQMHRLFAFRAEVLGGARDRKLIRVWRSLGSLLCVLITLDQLIQSHSLLKQHWTSFLKTMQVMHHNPAQFGAESEYLRPLQSVIVHIDAQLMAGSIFKNCCDQPLNEEVQGDVELSERLRSAVFLLHERWTVDEVTDKHRLMVMVSLTVLHAALFNQVDKKLFKLIWATHKRLPAFHLIGDIVWTPCEFIMSTVRNIEKVIDRKSLSTVKTLRSTLFDQQTDVLVREAASNIVVLNEWRCELALELSVWPGENAQAHLMHRVSLLMKGVRQADAINRLVRMALNGHLVQQKAVSRSSAVAIFRLIELIKGIQETFVRWWDEVLETCQQATQQWSGQILRLVYVLSTAMRTEGTALSYQNVDTLSALCVVQIALAGPVTRNRLIVAGVALEMAAYMKVFRWSDVQLLDTLLVRLDQMVNFGKVVNRACDCSFLYSHSTLIDVYMDSLLDDASANPKWFFEAVNDTQLVLLHSRHAPPQEAWHNMYTDMYTQFEKRFLAKLCAAVETDVRLSMHAHLQLEERKESARLLHLLHSAPLQIGDLLVDIQRFVERYLEKTFYNLTAVALHDCHTYSVMRLLASHKYGLVLCDSALPMHSLDQGLDVLLVTRNLPLFISSHNYNLNAQFFVQNDSKNKQLNILTVEHIANSIRTHGLGIMNTTINLAYQYLKKKLFVLSQFLFDEHIKSQLTKDVRFFRENADQLDKMYPVSRAQRFNSAIRRLGVSSDDLSFLDKFRILISHIGNVMGYVRLVRSGGTEASWQSLSFLPDLEDIATFAPLAQDANVCTHTLDAARIVDALFHDASKNLNQTNNYLQILLEVFAKEFRNMSKFDHLGNFYMIVPPLTINYTEHMLASKGKLGRRSNHNNTFTDDGFILGVAFILSLLDQRDEFASLNWFQSVDNRCTDEIARVTHDATRRGTMEPSVALRFAKLEHYQKEFRLLLYNFSSANIFFRPYQATDDPPNGTESSGAEPKTQ